MMVVALVMNFVLQELEVLSETPLFVLVLNSPLALLDLVYLSKSVHLELVSGSSVLCFVAIICLLLCLTVPFSVFTTYDLSSTLFSMEPFTHGNFGSVLINTAWPSFHSGSTVDPLL